MQLHDLQTDEQSQPEAAEVPLAMSLVKALEDARPLLERDAQPAVADRQPGCT